MTKYKDYHTFFNELFNLHCKGITTKEKHAWNEAVCKFINKNNSLLKDNAHFFDLLRMVDAQCQLLIADNPTDSVRSKIKDFLKGYYGKAFAFVKAYYVDGCEYEHCYNICKELSLKRINYNNMQDKAGINQFFVQFAHTHLNMIDEIERKKEAEKEYEAEVC